MRDLADEEEEDRKRNEIGDVAKEDAQSEDDFVPDEGAKNSSAGSKRGRTTRNKAEGRRRAVIADDEDEADEAERSIAPQKKRAKLADGGAAKKKGAPSKAKNGRARTAVDYSSDDGDEEMVDAASDEEDLADAAAAPDSEDDFDHEDDGRSKRGKRARKGRDGKKASGHPFAANATSKASTSTTGKKAIGSAATATPSSATGGGKAMSAEARMRASIDAAKDKSLKPPLNAYAGKLNPQASAFRPSGAKQTGSGASTPNTRPASAAAGTATGVKRTPSISGGKQVFGKSMSGWDQLFGGLSGLSSATSTPKTSTPTKPGSKPATPSSASANGIRPDPQLEAASAVDVQRLREEAKQGYLNTDECFDLLAHADIMLAFERSVLFEDKRLAARLRPNVWRAGGVLVKQAGQQ